MQQPIILHTTKEWLSTKDGPILDARRGDLHLPAGRWVVDYIAHTEHDGRMYDARMSYVENPGTTPLAPARVGQIFANLDARVRGYIELDQIRARQVVAA